MLSCSTLAARADGKKIVTLEGMQEEAKELGNLLQMKEQSSVVSAIRDLL